MCALLALGVAQGATIFTTTNANAANNAGNGYYGFATKLTSPGVMSTTTGGEEATLPNTVYLNNLTLTMRNSGSGNSFKVAIYAYTADGTVGELIGLSSNANDWSASAELNFNFDNVALDSTTTYQYLFVSENTVWDDLNKTAGTENMNAYKSHAVSESLSMSQGGSLPSGSGTYKNNTLNSWEGQYLPVVAFSTSDKAVPEPAAATMGLFGLSALLFRRRRS